MFLLDFGALMPEINSARMYAGAGSGPMLAAAAGWSAIGAELRSAAAGYQVVVDGLTAVAWQGPSALAMTAAATVNIEWLQLTAGQAELSAARARTVAAAYEAAFAATVPPPVVAANRTLLAALIATNILGQNMAAIAATEAHYAVMWAQDAAAMYGYAVAAVPAAELEPFTAPRPTSRSAPMDPASATSAAGTAQNVLSQLTTAAPNAVQAVAPAAAAPLDPASVASFLNSALGLIIGPLSPISFLPLGAVPFLLGIQSFMLPFSGQNLSDALAAQKPPIASMISGPGVGGMNPAAGARPVSAGLGGANLVGKLSVPPSWAATVPGVPPVTTALADAARAVPVVEGQAGLWSPIAASALAGRAAAAGSGTARSFSVAGATAEEATTATIIVLPSED